MRSTFGAFNASRSGLFAAQRALDIVGHNLSNVNTPGYTRQRLNQTNARPLQLPGGKGPIGQGVEMVSITQIRNEFLDIQFRKETETLGFWEERYTYLTQIESTFNEPSDKSIASALNNFYASMHEVAKTAADPTARKVMVQNAVALCENLNFMATRFEKLIEDLNSEVEATVRKINTCANQIATLNKQIYEVEIDGSHANDLRDKRNLVLDELSKLVNIQVVNVPDEATGGRFSKMNVLVQGTGLVMHDYVNEIALEKNQEHKLTLEGKKTNPPRNDLETVRITNLKWSTGSYIHQDQLGGTLGGQIDMRDNFDGNEKGIPYYLRMINEYAFEFARKFNEIHSHKDGRDLNGNRGLEFFKPDGNKDLDALNISDPMHPGRPNSKYKRINARNIRVNEAILTQSSLVAVARVHENPPPHGSGIDNNKNLEELIKIREEVDFTMDVKYMPAGKSGEKQPVDFVFKKGTASELIKDPALAGIKAEVEAFQAALKALKDAPDDAGKRDDVKDKAVALVNKMKGEFTAGEDIKTRINTLDAQVVAQIGALNTALTNIAGATGAAREAAISALKGLVGAEAVTVRYVPLPTPPGGVRNEVLINGVVVVSGNTASTVQAKPGQKHPLTLDGEKMEPKRKDLDGVTVTNFEIAGPPAQEIPMKPIGGTIGDIINKRDDYTDPANAAYKARALNEFANAFAESFNQAHKEGFDANGDPGLDFFVGGGSRISAENISINATIVADSSKIATESKNGKPADNLSQIINNYTGKELRLKIEYKGEVTRLAQGKPDDVMKSLIGVLGVDGAESKRKTQNQKMITESVDGYRKSVSGVSQDEEMSNMIRYQHAYNASARMITTIDEMIDVIVNRMGRVGL